MSEVHSSTNERENRLAKLNEIEGLSVNPYPNRYIPEKYSVEIKKQFEDNGDQAFNTNAAGRIILLRSFGKAIFATIKDYKGSIQIYARKDIMSESDYHLFNQLDIGDVIGVQGEIFRTHKGEITILIKTFTLLAKSLMPLPEKWHGLTDMETRYRQRYVDLIINDQVKNDFITRSKIINFIRDFLIKKEFIEVETPMMQAIPGGASARPFITHHNALSTDMYLRVAPELYLKRLIVGGFERVFELNRNFRNEGIDTRHNPEFTMLELYQAYGDFQTMMNLFEELMKNLAIHIKGDSKFEYQGEMLDFSNWRKIKYKDAIKEFAEIDTDKINSVEDAIKAANSKGVEEVDPFLQKWGVLNLIFEECVEYKLMEPTIVYEYPAEISPLSKYKENDREFVERFEPYAVGRELGNAFSELNNPIVQKERFLAQVARKAGGDFEAMFYDEDFITALEYGMPPTGGMGIGIDRLVMLLINTNSIRDTILFPTLKPRNKETQKDDNE